MWSFRRKKSPAERVREEAGALLADVGEQIDETIEKVQERAPAVRAEVEQRLRKTRKRTGKGAAGWRRLVAGKQEARAPRLRALAGDGLGERVAHLPEAVGAKVAGVTTGIGETVTTVPETVTEKLSEVRTTAGQTVSSTSSEIGERFAHARYRGTQRVKWAYTGFWLWLLRLGTGLWWLESARQKNAQGAFSGEGSNFLEQKLAAVPAQPVPQYRQVIQEYVAPRTSLVANILLIGELFAAFGLLTGIMKRRAALVGLFLNANYALLSWDNPSERDQNLMMALAETVILATDA